MPDELTAEELTAEEVEKRVRAAYQHAEKVHLDRTVTLLRALEERCGPQVREVVAAVYGERTRRHWENVAERAGSNAVDDLVRVLWESNADVFDFTVERREGEVQMRCTRCPFFDMARELNAVDWGYDLFCASDPHIVAGFNPRLGFQRSKTLMQGDDCCDHCYLVPDDLPGAGLERADERED